MKNKSDFNNYNHSFEEYDEKYIYDTSEFVKCRICNLKVWVGETTYFSFDGAWKEMNISCEEMQIKTLLE